MTNRNHHTTCSLTLSRVSALLLGLLFVARPPHGLLVLVEVFLLDDLEAAAASLAHDEAARQGAQQRGGAPEEVGAEAGRGEEDWRGEGYQVVCELFFFCVNVSQQTLYKG